MQVIRQSFTLLKKNFKSVFLFEAAYKLMCFALFTPILVGLFNLSLHLAGYRYLSDERLFSYVTSPSTILLLLLMLLVITAVTLLDMAAIITCFHASYHHQHITITEMFQAGLLAIKKLFLGRNFLFVLFIIIIIPVTNFTVVSGYISSLAIPDFILSFIRAHASLFTLLWIGFAICAILSVRWCLSIHGFCLEHGDFRVASARSSRMMKHRFIRTLLQLFLWDLLVLLCFLIVALLLIGLVLLFIRIFLSSLINFSAALGAVSLILTILFEIYACFSVPITFAYLSTCYYQELPKHGRQIAPYHAPKAQLFRHFNRELLFSLVIAACVFNIFYVGVATIFDVPWNQNIISSPEITAHRGDSLNAPENTLPAFESAITNHVDCAELDVQQTKDGVIVVMHDSNLKRTTGLNKNIWNVDYATVATLDAGSWFDSSYAGTTIPTLEEVLALCRGKIRLNIELKPTGHEDDATYIPTVLALIETYHFENDCVIASKSASALAEVKKENPDITTIYLMPVAYGDFSEMTFADGFSIESSFITATMVNHIHDAGKQIYAWTINDESSMERMFRLGVDSLITDKPIEAQEVYYSQSMNDTLVETIRDLFPKFP